VSAWVPVIGLEVHVQLATDTKLFCGCLSRFGAEPNTLTCPVCTGQPGALPVLNERALELAVRAALALGCAVADWSKFDRKNYFYCDLPKGYQISQYDRPLCTGGTGGGIRLSSGRLVRLNRIHMEEDAGKAIHDRGPRTLVDLNRAGVPLIEAVSEADLASAAQAYEYLTALKEVLEYAGVSDCDMEKGSLRCDVNVSVHPEGEGWRTKVEVKNLNSFRNVEAAIEYEIRRQVAAYEGGDPARYPVQETRLFDAQAGVTRSMRGKEDESDYRYFPEPDLPPFHVDAAFRARQAALLPEMPKAKRRRYQEELGLSEYDAGVLTAARDVASFFEAVAARTGRAKEAANWVSNSILAGLSDAAVEAATIADLPFGPEALAEVLELVERGTITKTAGRQVVAHMLAAGGEPAAIVAELGLEQVQDSGRIEEWCRAALAGKDRIALDVKAGNLKALGAAIGSVMKLSGGSADPEVVRETLLRIIREEL